jgi:hypothetical protein
LGDRGREILAIIWRREAPHLADEYGDGEDLEAREATGQSAEVSKTPHDSVLETVGLVLRCGIIG